MDFSLVAAEGAAKGATEGAAEGTAEGTAEGAWGITMVFCGVSIIMFNSSTNLERSVMVSYYILC